LNTYPTFSQRKDSERETITQIYASVGPNNQLYTNVYQRGNVRRRFVLRHVLDSAQRSTLRTFYQSNRGAPFFFRLTDSNDDGQYQAVFVGRPSERKLSSGYWLFEVELETWNSISKPGSFLLLESGDYLLQENGDKIGIE